MCWSGFFTEIQSTYLIGLESAEGYPLTVNDIPQAREIPKKTPLTMMYLWVQCLLPGVGTRHPFRWGKRRTQQIPFVVNNNRADIKITVAIPRDRRPPISWKGSGPKETLEDN
ncbi:hypothetical protein TNCV_3948981 [Trichonephila clavipes]|nr:hypothetical protein TNCV_3948981 [Trichonephila clavipes]